MKLKAIPLFLTMLLLLGACKKDDNNNDNNNNNNNNAANAFKDVKFDVVTYTSGGSLLYKNVYSYDGEKLKKVERTFSDQTTKYIWDYNYNGNIIEEIAGYNIMEYKSTEKYFKVEGDKTTEETTYTYIPVDGTLAGITKEVFEYTGGKLTVIRRYAAYDDEDDLKPTRLTSIFYNDNNFPVSVEYRVYDDGVLKDEVTAKDTFIYKDSKLIEYTTYFLNGDEYEATDKILFTYNGNKLNTSEVYSYDFLLGKPTIDATNTYTYNSNNQITTINQTGPSGSAKVEYTYKDGKSNLYMIVAPTLMRELGLTQNLRKTEEETDKATRQSVREKILPFYFFAL